MEESPRSGRIDDETGPEAERLSEAVACESDAGIGRFRPFHPHLVDELDSLCPGLPYEKLIDVGSVPMRIGDAVVRAGGNQQLVTAVSAGIALITTWPYWPLPPD
jgi:hypothetical protein